MAIKISTTQEKSRVHGIKCLVYAKAGLGKTMLSATAPAPIILSAESGLLSLHESNIVRVYGANAPGISYNIPVIEIKTVNDLLEAYNWVVSSYEAKQYYTVCLDSISEIAEVILSNAKSQVKDPRQAYGELIEKMTNTIRSFRDLSGKSVYFSAKQQFEKDQSTGIQSYNASMPGSRLAQELPYFFDEVFCLRVGKDTQTQQEFRYLQTAPDFQYDAKDRSGALAPMEIPNLTHVFTKILGV